VVAWGAAAGLELLAARRSATSGVTKLDDFKASMSPAKLIRGEGLAELRRAERDFARADDHVGSPVVAPLRILPIVGRQVRSVDALTASAKQVIAAGTSAVGAARREIDGRQSNGPGRVSIVEHLGGIVDRTRTRLRTVDLGPSQALIGPVAKARDRFVRELDRLRSGLDETSTASKGMLSFLRGPTRYLVLAANNAEMRAGSGMFLSAGELTIVDGKISIDEMRPTWEMMLAPGAASVGGDLAARWGWTAPNQEWRNLAMSPRFDSSAELAARMWKARTGHPVDGVLVLDPVALQAVLRATGPVQAEGLTVDASNVVDEILHEQYVRFKPGRNGDPTNRHEAMAAIATASLQALDRSGWDVATLVDALKTAAEGRHVLAWSSKGEQQRGWTAAGIDGKVGPDSVLIGLMNQGGNKLDPFIHASANLSVSDHGAVRDVVLDVGLDNRSPTGEPPLIIGPTAQLAEGEYAAILSVNVPAVARDLRIDGAPKLVAAGSDGPTQVIATRLRIARNARLHTILRFSVPAAMRTFEILPSARVPGIEWAFRGQHWTDDRGRRARW